MKWVLIALVYFSSGATDSGTSLRWIKQEFRTEATCKLASKTMTGWTISNRNNHGWNRSTIHVNCFLS